ncbi:MAG: segregation/condensation protein A [Gammaproteobacteria bacterium]|nr:segregation/condensation protein A [Gammaproteobacteria bacterium]MDH5652127.1 segregation/condensation protein A [Gammaproteobacteria bacterium]
MTDSLPHNPQPQQEEMPFAIVQGTAITSLPKDLYIPPDALEIFLAESFEGPLDLLLYLIKRQNLDILDIPIAEITRQYVVYVELMKELRLELAAEYLVMAAMLAEIKSRMLLPRPVEDDLDEDDPRAELVRRLQEYERYKQAAEDIDQMPRVNREIHLVELPAPDLKVVKLPPRVDMRDLMKALNDVMKRAENYAHHHITMEPLSVRERMSIVLGSVKADEFTEFTTLFTVEEGRGGVVVTLLAILELIKQSLIELIQTEMFGPIHVKAVGQSTATNES